jgi:uncharacterized protein YgbK (DUF1537 family)
MADQTILVLADDLTGALEVGGKFAAAGVRSLVKAWTRPLCRDLRDVVIGALVVDTETRHVEATEAARRVSALAQAARTEGFTRVYKKTDSTLRGNIGAELAALMEVYTGSPLLYVPAYPGTGRTVRSGCLYVDGALVTTTGFAGDALNPVTESHIPSLLAAQCRLPVRSMGVTDLAEFESGYIVVCDGETDADVESAARAFVNSTTLQLAAGPAAFATHLARLVDAPRCPPPSLPSVGNALIVNGSLNQVSVQQVEQAKRDGFATFYAGPDPVAPPNGGWLIMEQVGGAVEITPEFAKGLAKSACEFLAHSPVDGLVVFGGDTAYALLAALGHPPLYPTGEVMEGIPISRIEAKQITPSLGPRDRDLYLVTKAGGFGPPEVLTCLRSLLAER